MNFKITYIKLFGFLLIAVTLVGCSKDFLEVTPKGSLIAQNVEDYDRLLEDLSLNELTNIAIPMGDEIAAIDPAFSAAELRTRRLFQWEAEIYNSDQNPQELDVLMKSIYTYNKVINEVSDATNGTEAEKNRLAAEARIGRAFSYFILINYYGKPYDQSTASVDLGFPIVEENDITATNFTRNTVQEVYDFIINDIELALPNLSSNVDRRNRASRASGEALLGKVLMFQHKFDLALEHLNSALNYLSNSEVELSLYDYNIEFEEGGVFTPLDPFFGPASVLRRNNAEVLYDKQYVNGWAFIFNEFVINTETANLYESTDLRLNFFSDREFFGFVPYYPNGMLRKIGPLSQQYGIYLPDLYLLIIEAKARTGLLQDAASELETFRTKRMPVENAPIPEAVSTNQYELVKFIFEERIREFSVSGFRWFDMRRLSVDPEYSDLVNYTHNVFNSDGELLDSYTLTSERLVLRFGGVVRAENPNLVDNP